MGHWGYGPFQNDSAMHLVADLGRHVKLAVERKTNLTASSHYAEARAAAPFLLMAHGTDRGPDLENVLRALLRMRMDTVWLSDFDEPAKVTEALDFEIDSIVAGMRGCKTCKKKLGKNPHRGLLGLVALAKYHVTPKGLRWSKENRASLVAARRSRLPKKKARAGRRR